MKMYQYTQTNPTIFGTGTIAVLGEKIKEFGCRKVLVVTDQGLIKVGVVDKILEQLKKSEIEAVVFDKIMQDPVDTVCNEGGEFAISENVDGIIAVGGGSVMDAAKAINILTTNGGPISKYYGTWEYKPVKPLIMIPTTAGTGSENTIYGVITENTTGVKKVVLTTGSLAICDAELTYKLPSSLTASTGMDVFAHAAESMTCNATNPKSDLLGEKAIELVCRWLPVAVHEPDNKEARQNMMLASNFAGIAFSDACCHLGHAFSQCMGAKFHIAHGISCAWALPEVMKYSATAVPEKVKCIARAMKLKFSENISDEEIGQLVADKIREIMIDIGVKSIRDYGYTREDTISISEIMMKDNCFPFLPKSLNEQEVKEILGRIYDTY